MAERWYEFTQVEVLPRPFYVRARTLKEARQLVREHPSGNGIGVPDYAGHPDSILIRGRGRLAHQQDAQDLADEREEQGGW